MTAEAKLAARTMTKAERKAFNRAERLGRTAESWTTTRQNTWKAIAESELANPTGQYSRANIRRMVEGLAPKVRAEVTSNKTGLTTTREISMELHHRSLPQRFRTPTANEPWNLERFILGHIKGWPRSDIQDINWSESSMELTHSKVQNMPLDASKYGSKAKRFPQQ